MAPTSVHTLVIADDHVLTRDGLRGLVASMGGFDIVGEAENGLEAISIIKQTQPDLAILDLKMPYTNGAEAYLEIRRWSPRTKVVILTGLSSPALFRELRDSEDWRRRAAEGSPAGNSRRQQDHRGGHRDADFSGR